jgi:lathosterol oxidase
MQWALFAQFVAGSVLFSLAVYFGIGGFLQVRYYRARRAEPQAWKCQPNRWLQPALARHAILLGTFNMAAGAAVSGGLAYLIRVHGVSRLYTGFDRHGVGYTLATTVLFYLFTDAGAYYSHRMFHSRLLFPRIHKWHHRYTIPNAFTVSAMHPLEWFFYQAILFVPAFIVPLHVASFVGVLLYIYYFGLIDHSGIKMSSWLPWQPPVQFHDDHHKYFHCNFGQNSALWDRLHGTVRMGGRRYGEHVYGGRGAPGADDEGEAIRYR